MAMKLLLNYTVVIPGMPPFLSEGLGKGDLKIKEFSI